MPAPVTGLFLGGLAVCSRNDTAPKSSVVHEENLERVSEQHSQADLGNDGDISELRDIHHEDDQEVIVPEPYSLSNVGIHILSKWTRVDQLIVNLKTTHGFTDEKAASKMNDLGYTNWTPKTLGTRWQKLRKALEQAEDERLDDQCHDWLANDDANMCRIYSKVSAKYDKEIATAELRRWRQIAHLLGQASGNKRFSHNACRLRYTGLQQGNCELPLDQDPDQRRRRQARADRVRIAQQLRREIIEGIVRPRAERLEAHNDRQRRLEASDVRRIANNQKIKEERAAKERRKLEFRQNDQARLLAKARAREYYDTMVQFDKDIQEKENQWYQTITGEARVPHDLSSLENDEFLETDNQDHNGFYPAGMGSSSLRPESRISITTPSIKSEARSEDHGDELTAAVTRETLLNPRSIMTDHELAIVCAERGVPRRARAETHAQLVARLAAADLELTTGQLSEQLRKYFDKGRGSKAEKALRLAGYQAAESAAGRNGVQASHPSFKRRYNGYSGPFADLLSDDATEMTESNGQ